MTAPVRLTRRGRIVVEGLVYVAAMALGMLSVVLDWYWYAT